MPSLPRRAHTIWYRIQRLKTTSLTEHAYTKEEPRFHTIFDLVLVGLWILPMSLFALCGDVSKNLAGPSAILSALFAAMASGLAGLSYSELRTRVNRLQAPAYEYMYRVVGEMAAFAVGWIFILHHVMCSSAVSRVISQNLDYLLDGRISNLTAENIGSLPRINSSVDLLAFCMCLMAMLAVVVDLSMDSRIVSIILTSMCLFVLLFALVIGLYHLDFDHWKTVDNFFPQGIGGVMCAASVLTYAFWSSETILRSCDMNTRGIRRPALTSILIVHIFTLAILVLLISSVTLLTGSWSSTAPFAEAFSNAGMRWMRYIICPLAILVLPSVLLREIKQAVKSLSLMGTDGLLPQLFANKSPKTDTAVVSTIMTGLASSLGALFLSLSDLVQIIAIPVIIMQITACVVTVLFHYKAEEDPDTSKRKRKRRKKTLTTSSASTGAESLRYGSTGAGRSPNLMDQPLDTQGVGVVVAGASYVNNNNKSTEQDSSSDTDIDDIVEEYTHEQIVRELTENTVHSDFRRRSTMTSFYRVCAALTVFVFCTMGLGLIVTDGSHRLTEGNVGLIVLLIMALISLLISAIVMARQPRDSIQPYTVMLHVPHVPWTPMVAILMNTMMLVSVGITSAITLIIWLLTGLCIYLLYGLHHSHESQVVEHFPAEHRGLIHSVSGTSDQSRALPKVLPEPELEQQQHYGHEDSQDDVVLIDCS